MEMVWTRSEEEQWMHWEKDAEVARKEALGDVIKDVLRVAKSEKNKNRIGVNGRCYFWRR